MDAAGVPRIDPLRAAEGLVADERVAAAVVVACVVVGAVMILLYDILASIFFSEETQDMPLPNTTQNKQTSPHQTFQTSKEHEDHHEDHGDTSDDGSNPRSHSTRSQHAGHSAIY